MEYYLMIHRQTTLDLEVLGYLVASKDPEDPVNKNLPSQAVAVKKMTINVRQKQSWKDFSNKVGFKLANERFTELNLNEAIFQNGNYQMRVECSLR